MTVWIDASAGASGDMLLGALVGAGVPVEVLQDAVDAIAPEPVNLRVEQVTRNGFAATRCHVEARGSTQHRSWRDIRGLLKSSRLDEDIRALAFRVFERLAEAEAAVHGSDPHDVTFHEVGALDAIADVVGACAGFAHLGSCAPQRPIGSSPAHDPAREVVVSPVAVGSGTVQGAHGVDARPAPGGGRAAARRAVVRRTGGSPRHGAVHADRCRDPDHGRDPLGPAAADDDRAGRRRRGQPRPGGPRERPAALRRWLRSTRAPRATRRVLIETNVDDLDPRVWPSVITALLDAGASDAWLTPILMKKGRPAHALSVLVPPDRAEAVRATVFRETSAIGVREQRLDKHALDREMSSVDVDGHTIAVKLARHEGAVVNAMPEYDDVARAAAAVGRPVADVLADAVAASRKLLG